MKEISAPEVIAGNWVKDAALFIMHGGADLSYLKVLKGKGDQAIRKFVHVGGTYLGICAGAYYAANFIEFSPHTDIEIFDERFLKFYPGTTYGLLLAS